MTFLARRKQQISTSPKTIHSMNQSLLPVESIQERDLDLLLLEELSSDRSFREWFVNALNLPPVDSFLGAWKSISAFGLGETDLLFSYKSEQSTLFLLLENKLDTHFQEEQYSRYILRARNYEAKKECDSAFVVLVAPLNYCIQQNEFEKYITYESIAQRLEMEGTPRSLFKVQLIQIAIRKQRRGYRPTNSLPVQTFWKSYWTYLQNNSPSIPMKMPQEIPHKSDWPILKDKKLHNITFYHKLSQGIIDATLNKCTEEQATKIREYLPEWASLKKNKKSYSIQVATDSLDRTKAFFNQIDSVDKSIRTFLRLQKWIHENIHLLPSSYQ